MPLDPPAVLAVRARRALVRPTIRRALAIVVGLATALTVVWQIRGAEAARQRWSETRPVAVARRDLEPGDLVTPTDVDLEELPTAAVAEAALATVPVGVVVRHPIAAGEPLVDERLGREGLAGVAALVPEGHRAVTITLGSLGAPPVQVGDTVDVVAVIPTEADLHGHSDADPDEPDGSDGSADDDATSPRPPPAVPLVDRALVVDVADDAVTVAVPATDAPAVAYAAVQGIAVILLTGA
jgi:hypothetical protein